MADVVKKSNKPKNNAIRQQRLKAWQPILTPKNVLPTLFVIGLSFIPVGIGLFIASKNVNEFSFEYTDCNKTATAEFSKVEGLDDNNDIRWKYDTASKICTIEFTIKEQFKKPVFLYYRLTSFYQNHRSYVKSYDANQLLGKDKIETGDLTSNCNPVRENEGKQYFPCGLIANSMFSDIFSNKLIGEKTEYEFTTKDIAWPTDAEKYGTKQDFLKLWGKNLDNLVPPPNWVTSFEQYKDGKYTEENFPDLKNWEAFQVWMRTAGLPNFRKLYAKNVNHDLEPGKYTINITNSYDVDRYGGTKAFVITTTSILGGKNPFLGIAYLFVGIISCIFGVVFLARHLYKPRKLGDHKYLSWNKNSSISSSATAQNANDGGEEMN